MIRKFCSLVFCVIASLLLLAGCSSHPPSAAQFMNVKKNEGSLSLGGVFLSGDLYDKEGTLIEDVDKGFFFRSIRIWSCRFI